MEQAKLEPCWTCRNRHVQCDCSEVPCAKCQKAGLECHKKLPVRWVKGVAIRGKMQGFMYEPKSNFSVKKPKRFRFKPSIIKSASRNSDNPSFVLPIALPEPSLSNLDEASKYYLDYYNNRICSNFVIYDSNKNQLRKLIPFALEDTVLRNAVLGLAARHLANQGQSFNQFQPSKKTETVKFNHDALVFKYQAIVGLSRVLGSSKQPCKDTSLASIFLLILLDLLELGGDDWQFHLQGAQNLLTSRFSSPPEPGFKPNQESLEMIQDIRDFVTYRMSLIETLGSLFLPRSPSHGIVFDQKQMTQDSIDYSFIACPGAILNAIRSISFERDSIAQPDMLCAPATQAHIQATTAVIALTEQFNCATWASDIQEPHYSNQDIHFLAVVAHVYKLAALLYGNRVLAMMKQVDIVQDDLLLELLGLLNGLRDKPQFLKCVLWPIFVAGLECRSSEQKVFFLARLEEFWMTTHCLNAINAAKLLREYWQRDERENLCWVSDVGRFGQAWLLI